MAIVCKIVVFPALGGETIRVLCPFPTGVNKSIILVVKYLDAKYQKAKLKDKLTQSGYISVVIPYSPGLYLKDSAALAGIGPIGKNNLLITPDYGSQIRLRAIVTTAPLICGEPLLESEYCKECDICMRACPANAFIDGKYTKNICNEWARANWEILSKHTVIWCNVCIEECPVTKKRKS